MSKTPILSTQNLASFYLVVMCIQFIPFEGWGVSNIKVGAMALACAYTWVNVGYFTKGTIWLLGYMFTVIFSAVVWNNNYRISTLGYQLLFIITFNFYYKLVYSRAFSVDYFLRLLKSILFAYIIVLLLQQFAIIAGIRYFPIINLITFLDRGLGANALALEPSHSARIMAVAFYAFLKVSEFKQGSALSIKQLFIDNRWLVLGFLYAMVTMGSGTAFVALAILSLYFMKRKYVFFIIPVALLLYWLIAKIDYEPLNRARSAIDVSLQGDTELMQTTDGSAASRINPILNTLQDLDLSKKETWFGKGSDTAIELEGASEQRLMGNINDYGLLTFIVGIFFIFYCCIPGIFSLPTLLIFALVGFSATNIAYIWGVYMLLVPVKYFYKIYGKFNGINSRHLRV